MNDEANWQNNLSFGLLWNESVATEKKDAESPFTTNTINAGNVDELCGSKQMKMTGFYWAIRKTLSFCKQV